MRAYQTRRGGRHVAAERNGGRLAPEPVNLPKIAVIGTYRRFRLWVEENRKLAANAIHVSSPDTHRVLGLDIRAVVVLDYLPGMTGVIEELRARALRSVAA